MMINYNELCVPFIKAAQKCEADTYSKLEIELQKLGFFTFLPDLQTFEDYINFIDKSLELQNLVRGVAISIYTDSEQCDIPAITLQGEVVNPSKRFVDDNGESHEEWINAGKILHCSRLVSDFDKDGFLININVDNLTIEMLNRNGFDLPLLELPNYSNDEIQAMFNL